MPVRHRQSGLGSERSLVLHAHLVEALDDHRPRGVLVATPDSDPSEHLITKIGIFRISERFEALVLHNDGCRCLSSSGIVLGGDNGHRLTPEVHHLLCKNRLVSLFQPKRCSSGHVVGCQDSVHPSDGEGRSNIDREYAGMGMWASCGRAPKHSFDPLVLGVLELTPQLGDAIGSECRLANALINSRRALFGPSGHADSSARASKARMMEPYPVQRQMFPARASLISRVSGRGLWEKRSVAATTMPGVQNPH